MASRCCCESLPRRTSGSTAAGESLEFSIFSLQSDACLCMCVTSLAINSFLIAFYLESLRDDFSSVRCSTNQFGRDTYGQYCCEVVRFHFFWKKENSVTRPKRHAIHDTIAFLCGRKQYISFVLIIFSLSLLSLSLFSP